MFKVGQVWRNNLSGNLYLVVRVPQKHFCEVLCIAGSYLLKGGNLGVTEETETSYKLIGNNYQERGTRQEEKPAIDKRTHNLITRLRASNNRLRQMNSDLRDDIGDMASKPHQA